MIKQQTYSVIASIFALILLPPSLSSAASKANAGNGAVYHIPPLDALDEEDDFDDDDDDNDDICYDDVDFWDEDVDNDEEWTIEYEDNAWPSKRNAEADESWITEF
jgi:ketosteroid isomerase-like protein